MKKNSMFLLAFVPGLVAGAGLVIAFHENPEVEQRESQTRIEKPFVRNEETKPTAPEVTLAMKPATPKVKGDDKGCVFKTVFGEESSDNNFIYKTPLKVKTSIEEALSWIAEAQSESGGWGAGTHSNQNIMDPHAVHSDPATTAMVAMSILRCGSTVETGPYASHLKKALNYLLKQVEASTQNSLNITSETGTQPQIKLGQNIDVVLTSQFLTNVLDELGNDNALRNRVKRCNQICISKIQKGQTEAGSLQGAGWAGVLQSSFATNALETAKDKGMDVDEKKLTRAKEYQKSNFDVTTNNAATEDAAGVVLYSVSGSGRASAKEARKAKDVIEKAKQENKLDKAAPVSIDNLKKAGMSESEALRYGSAYKINVAANEQAQQDNVMSGFGSNGGEEFLSYLQTGEGLIMSKDQAWKSWYDNISGRLVRIQNNDGSWNGHHCITSPVFCTATSLLILAVNNDVSKLVSLGGK
ncbi:MAG: terpene cyclase/mutase family protein [Bacteroidetes bacterium]|nr:terpene cyclase/mutase family protein [Bacteroidota bacterium]